MKTREEIETEVRAELADCKRNTSKGDIPLTDTQKDARVTEMVDARFDRQTRVRAKVDEDTVTTALIDKLLLPLTPPVAFTDKQKTVWNRKKTQLRKALTQLLE